MKGGKGGETSEGFGKSRETHAGHSDGGQRLQEGSAGGKVCRGGGKALAITCNGCNSNAHLLKRVNQLNSATAAAAHLRRTALGNLRSGARKTQEAGGKRRQMV